MDSIVCTQNPLPRVESVDNVQIVAIEYANYSLTGRGETIIRDGIPKKWGDRENTELKLGYHEMN